MIRDILGNRIKKITKQSENMYLEKYYVHNNKVFQIVRLYIFDNKRRTSNEKIECEIYFKKQAKYNNKKKKVIEKVKRRKLLLSDLKNKELFNTYSKAEKRIKGRFEGTWNRCYFKNNDGNKILKEKLFEIGYKNFSYQSNTSYWKTPLTIIEKGKLLTTHQKLKDLLEEGIYIQEIKILNGEIVKVNND